MHAVSEEIRVVELPYPKNVKSAIADIEPPFEPLVSIAILFKSSASRSSGVLGVIASEVRLMIDKDRRLDRKRKVALLVGLPYLGRR